jgi:hypothetical protein
MAALILPRRVSRQPQQFAQIDWGNSLSSGLVFCAYPLGNGFYEVISNQTTGHPGTSRARHTVDGNRELAVSHIGANGVAGGRFTNITGLDILTGVCSMFAEASMEVNATNFSIATSRETAVTGNGVGIVLDDINVTANSIQYYANNSVRATSNSCLGSNSENFTHRMAFTADGTNCRFYAKGLLQSTVATTVLPSAHVNRRTTICGRDLTQNGGSVALVLAWNRVLSLAEYQALYENPWQIFQPINRRIFLDVTAAPGGGFQSAWAMNSNQLIQAGVAR